MYSKNYSNIGSPLPSQFEPENCLSDASLMDLELSSFLTQLIFQNCAPPGDKLSPRLSQKIKWINDDPSQLALIDFNERNSLEFEIFTYINDSDKLSDKEKVFCLTIIKQYLLTPGYRTYQSFCRSIWLTSISDVNLNSIKEITDQIMYKINKVKEANEERSSYFESVFRASLPIAIELHRRLLVEVAKEKPPVFLDKTVQVECSYNQFEFALLEAERELGDIFSQAQNSIGMIYVTKLFQIILCGERVIFQPFQSNPVSFLMRESIVKKKPAIPITELHEGIGMLDSSFPIKGDNFCISHDSAENTPSFQLWVSWMTPRKSIEHLLSYLIETDSKPHRFTHPLTGPHLNVFADRCVEEFPFFLQSCLLDKTVIISFDKISSTEKSKHIKEIKENQKKISELSNQACECYPSNERELPLSFITAFLGIYTSSFSIDEFKSDLRDLMKNREYKPEFLNGILSLIKSSHHELLFLAKHHQRYRKSCETARTKAIKLHPTIRLAFSHEEIPTIHHRTGLIEVSYERFWVAFTLFNQSYRWMIEFASSEGDLALANHFLSILLCGKDAEGLLPVLRRNSHCFSIKDFNHAERCLHEDIDLKGLSYNHRLFNQMEKKDNKLSEQSKFVLNFKKACALYIYDAIVRNNYRVTSDREDFMSRELHFIPTLLTRYLSYLERRPSEPERIRKTTFYCLVKEHLPPETLCDALLIKNSTPLTSQIIENIFLFLKDVPENMRDLVFLKLIELMCALNQQIFLEASGTMSGKLSEMLFEKKFPFTVVPGFDFDYAFCWNSHLDALTCEGTILLCMVGKTPNSIFEKVFPAQIGARMMIPSFTDSHRSPRIELTQIKFNALSTVPFCEFVASQMNEALEKQAAHKWSSDQILNRSKQIAREAEALFVTIRELDIENMDSMRQIEKIFRDLFDIQNKLIILFSIYERDIKEKIKLLEIDTKPALKFLKKIFSELTRKKQTLALKQLIIQIKKWFPGF